MNGGLSQLLNERAALHGRGLAAGIVIGIVTNNSDPDGLSRVKVRFPWLSDENESFWARVVSPMAGNDRGTYFLPEVDDEVVVMFAHGDVRFPYVIGALWNGQDLPPADNADGENNLRVIKSRSGHTITLNDKADHETLEITDASGKNSIVFDTANGRITISADSEILLSVPNGAITLNANTIKVRSDADTEIVAGSSMKVQGGSALNLLGQPVNIN